MNTTILIYIGLLGVLLGLASSYQPIKKIIRIQRTPTTAIGALPLEGQVEAVGSAEGETVYSPLTQKACVYWQIRINGNRHGYGGISKYMWEVLDKRNSSEPFYINDGTGRIQIFPHDAELILRDEVNHPSYPSTTLDAHLKDVINKMGIDTANQRLSVYENIIEPGGTVYVLCNIKNKTISTYPPPVISDRSEKELLRTLYWQVFGNVLGFPVLIYFFLLTSHSTKH